MLSLGIKYSLTSHNLWRQFYVRKTQNCDMRLIT